MIHKFTTEATATSDAIYSVALNDDDTVSLQADMSFRDVQQFGKFVSDLQAIHGRLVLEMRRRDDAHQTQES